jgi:NTP pyrophosphatase (non-canonical NTP hydrolase)
MIFEINHIVDELKSAKLKHPDYPEDMFEQLAIMSEEAGEVAKAVLQYKREGGDLQEVKDELVQTAAMCIRMLENI